MSTYFSYLPNINVRQTGYRQDSGSPFVNAKNIFRRVKIRDELDDIILGFEKYYIQNSERPDQLAQKFYGDTKYDWVILLCNEITNLYHDWPMDEYELTNYVMRKYNMTNPSDIGMTRHWVTQEVKRNGRVHLEEGLEVPENFEYSFPDGVTIEKENLVRPVSYYQHETKENERKRQIYILRPEYLDDFVEEFFSLVSYLPNDELEVDVFGKDTKKTYRTVTEIFKPTKKEYTTEIGKTPSITFLAHQQLTS